MTPSVDPRLRRVTRVPLSEVWDDSGPVSAIRIQRLGVDEVRELLRLEASGVLAGSDGRLRWLSGVELFDWWKSEARSRLVAPDVERVFLEEFPDERCWIASEWRLADGTTAILFELWH